jgi:hypothetical protein
MPSRCRTGRHGGLDKRMLIGLLPKKGIQNAEASSSQAIPEHIASAGGILGSNPISMDKRGRLLKVL